MLISVLRVPGTAQKVIDGGQRWRNSRRQQHCYTQVMRGLDCFGQKNVKKNALVIKNSAQPEVMDLPRLDWRLLSNPARALPKPAK